MNCEKCDIDDSNACIHNDDKHTLCTECMREMQFEWDCEEQEFVPNSIPCECGGEMIWCTCCHMYSQSCCEDYGTCLCS